MARTVSVARIADALEAGYGEINRMLRPDVLAALQGALAREPSEAGRAVLSEIVENAELAARTGLTTCQDTGVACVFIRLGQEVRLTDGALTDAVNEGIRRAHRTHHLRASVVRHPLDRRNTGDNAPAMLHVELEPGEGLTIDLLAKGAGSENMGRVVMLAPAEGREGVVREVVETVRAAGGNPCPPIVVGVGIGGTQDVAALLAKKALFRDIRESSPDPLSAELEKTLLAEVNALGVGPMGLGGETTALAVLVETAPCHMASLPVAVNLMCHAFRHLRVEL